MVRVFLIFLGWLCVALASVGIFVPGIPTTPFLILALWAFAKSSKKFHTWLINHRRFGVVLRNWESHKVVPKKAKILMIVLQVFAIVIIQFSFNNFLITLSLFLIIFFVAWYVLSLPSEIPN